MIIKPCHAIGRWLKCHKPTKKQTSLTPFPSSLPHQNPMTEHRIDLTVFQSGAWKAAMQNLLCDSKSSFYAVVVSVVVCSGADACGAVTSRQQKLQPEALSGQLVNW